MRRVFVIRTSTVPSDRYTVLYDHDQSEAWPWQTESSSSENAESDRTGDCQQRNMEAISPQTFADVAAITFEQTTYLKSRGMAHHASSHGFQVLQPCWSIRQEITDWGILSRILSTKPEQFGISQAGKVLIGRKRRLKATGLVSSCPLGAETVVNHCSGTIEVQERSEHFSSREMTSAVCHQHSPEQGPEETSDLNFG